MPGLIDIQVRWAYVKDDLSDRLGLSHWELHAVVGLALFAATALAFRRAWPSWWLLVPLAGLELLNEISDVALFYAADQMLHWRASDAGIEIALTMCPAMFILLIARLRRPESA